MTPTRLREIAERLETTCLEHRLKRRPLGLNTPQTEACDGCKAAARELRELADRFEVSEIIQEHQDSDATHQ